MIITGAVRNITEHRLNLTDNKIPDMPMSSTTPEKKYGNDLERMISSMETRSEYMSFSFNRGYDHHHLQLRSKSDHIIAERGWIRWTVDKTHALGGTAIAKISKKEYFRFIDENREYVSKSTAKGESVILEKLFSSANTFTIKGGPAERDNKSDCRQFSLEFEEYEGKMLLLIDTSKPIESQLKFKVSLPKYAKLPKTRVNPNEYHLKRRVGVFGTFDLLHYGHIEFLRRASGYGTHLTAFVIPDDIVEQNKGKRPFFNAEQRRQRLTEVKCVDNAYISSISDPKRVLNANIDVFVFGPDEDRTRQERLMDLIREKRPRAKAETIDYYCDIHSSDIRKIIESHKR